jgi:hypothetical protein
MSFYSALCELFAVPSESARGLHSEQKRRFPEDIDDGYIAKFHL